MARVPAVAAMNVLKRSIDVVIPEKLVVDMVQRDGNILKLGSHRHVLDHNVIIVGFGKAVSGMCRALQGLLGDHITNGVLSIPKGITEDLKHAGKSHLIPEANIKVKIFQGAKNNVPDIDAHVAAQEIMRICADATDKNLVIALVSGGGSALLPAPLPPITIEEKCDVTRILAAQGATIQELNIVRQQMSQVKGGLLARIAHPAKIWGLILSDIIGDPLELIASGPTVTSNYNRNDALNICRKYDILQRIPRSVCSVLSRPCADQKVVADTHQVVNALIGSNETALKAAAFEAERQEYRPVVLGRAIRGEAKHLGHVFGQLGHYLRFREYLSQDDAIGLEQQIVTGLLEHGVEQHEVDNLFSSIERELARPTSKGLCVIGGGETTVTLQRNHGKGGRNQEIVLSAAIALRSLEATTIANPNDVVFLSAGTDGQDGPTPAAGALYDTGASNDFDLVKATDHLNRNDSYTFFKQLSDGLVMTGLTGTNVMDIHILLFSCKSA